MVVDVMHEAWLSVMQAFLVTGAQCTKAVSVGKENSSGQAIVSQLGAKGGKGRQLWHWSPRACGLLRPRNGGGIGAGR